MFRNQDSMHTRFLERWIYRQTHVPKCMLTQIIENCGIHMLEVCHMSFSQIIWMFYFKCFIFVVVWTVGRGDFENCWEWVSELLIHVCPKRSHNSIAAYWGLIPLTNECLATRWRLHSYSTDALLCLLLIISHLLWTLSKHIVKHVIPHCRRSEVCCLQLPCSV